LVDIKKGHRIFKVKFVDVKCGLKFTQVSSKSIRYWTKCWAPLEFPIKCGLYRANNTTGHCWHRPYQCEQTAHQCKL